MAPVNTLEIISEARHELKNRIAEREQTDKRIAELRLLLRSLVRFIPDQGVRQEIVDEVADAKRQVPSLTDSISQILSRSKTPITSNDIRDQLEASGFDLDEYSQPLATIQSTLQRLVDAQKVSRDLAGDKSVLYKWNTLADRVKSSGLKAPRPPASMRKRFGV